MASNFRLAGQKSELSPVRNLIDKLGFNSIINFTFGRFYVIGFGYPKGKLVDNKYIDSENYSARLVGVQDVHDQVR